MSWHYVTDERNPAKMPLCGYTGDDRGILFVTSSQPSLVDCDLCKQLMPPLRFPVVDER